ncbi:hypothetical protein ACXYMU_01380 [Pontibacter sp. CAU 1760]
MKKIKSTILALSVMATASLSLGACSKGTEPGDVNVGRGEIKDEGEMIDGDNGYNASSDTTDLEKYYDHADHENHDDNTGKVIGDGAYDGKGTGTERDDIKQ